MKVLAWGIIGAAILGVASGMPKGTLKQFAKNISGKLNMQGTQQMMQSAQQVVQGAQQMMQPLQQAGTSSQPYQQTNQSSNPYQQASTSSQSVQQKNQSSQQPIPQHNQQMNQSSK